MQSDEGRRRVPASGTAPADSVLFIVPAESKAIRACQHERRVCLVTVEAAGAMDHLLAFADVVNGLHASEVAAHEKHELTRTWVDGDIDRVARAKQAARAAKKGKADSAAAAQSPDKPKKTLKTQKGK